MRSRLRQRRLATETQSAQRKTEDRGQKFSIPTRVSSVAKDAISARRTARHQRAHDDPNRDHARYHQRTHQVVESRCLAAFVVMHRSDAKCHTNPIQYPDQHGERGTDHQTKFRLISGLRHDEPQGLSERLADAYQIAVWINDSKLPHPPRLIFEGVLAWDTFPGQLCRSKCPVNTLHV